MSLVFLLNPEGVFLSRSLMLTLDLSLFCLSLFQSLSMPDPHAQVMDECVFHLDNGALALIERTVSFVCQHVNGQASHCFHYIYINAILSTPIKL